MIFATPGHHFNKDHLPLLRDGDILLHGHTHIPACEALERGCRYCNPGSISIPKNGSKHGYMTLENGVLTWKTLVGEVWMTAMI